MTKEQFLSEWGFRVDGEFSKDLEALIANEIAKAKEAQPELNPIEQAYERGEKIRAKFWKKGTWAIKNSDTHAIDEKKVLWDVQLWDFKNKPEKWELYTEPAEQEPDQVADQVADQVQPAMTEKEKIDHILTNKLTWKPMGNKRFYANMIGGKASDGSRQVCFVDYNNPHSGYFETRIFNIDLSEWQPVETAQPSSQAKLDNSFDRDRFEAMFRAVVASGRTERWEQDFKFTEEALAKLDAYYSEKQGGNNG